MISQNIPAQISRLLRDLSQPARLEILLAIGTGEACVCHLEAMLNMRQAYISQHLMALRQAGILETRRDGRFVFYRLENPQIMEFIHLAAQMAGVPADRVIFAPGKQPHSGCCCPKCTPSVPVDGCIELHLSEAGS